MTNDQELLTGVSFDELQALAEGMLVPASQSRLDELVAAGNKGTLSASEQDELDDLLNKVDQLNLLKARALYTLTHATPQSSGG